MVRKEVDEYGTTRYCNELGQIHREGDEPAVIFKDGTVCYCKNDQRHRVAGPAWIWADGDVSYWIHDKQYTKEEFDNHPLVREYRLKRVVEDLLNG